MKVVVVTLSFALMTMPLVAARVQIVLDVSGSMRAPAGNMSRMEAAQRAVRATVEAIDPSSNVALRLYGHRLPSEPKEASCRDTELVIPFGPLDRQRFINAVTSAKPLGQTPLAYALEQAANDFGRVGDEPVAIILVSDGEESCGGDPAKVACALRQRGLEVTVHTVGFDVNAVARQQLQAVANCTGGEYRDAKNAAELAQSLQQLTQAGLVVQKQREVRNVGRAVRGGDGFGSAVPITPGTYRLDHHQRPKEYDYFTIDLKPGQIIRVSQPTSAVGVTIEGTKATENNSPVAGVTLFAPDQTFIAEDAKTGVGQRASVTASVTAGEGGKYYVLVGQKWWPWGIHHESPFTIEIIDAADAGSGTDAGETSKDALRVQPGRYSGWFQPKETKDTFWFDASAGSQYELRVRPEGEIHGLHLTVRDEDGVELARQSAPNSGAAVRLSGVKPAAAGRLYVTLSFIPVNDPIAYSLELTGAGTATAATGEPPPVTTEGTSGETTESEIERRISSLMKAGCGTCVAIALLLLLLIAGLVIFIVRMIRRNKNQPPPPQ